MIKIPGKIPILISPFFWLLAVAIGWLNTGTPLGTAVWTGIILVSVLVHELGHALTAIAFGQTAHIELVALGGVTYRRGGGKLKGWQDFIIVLNGPLAGFGLSLCAWWLHRMLAISHPESLVTNVVLIVFYVNLFWTVVNLVPVQPLDGGKLLTIIFEGLFGLRGKKIALFISLIVAGALGLLFFSLSQFLAGALFLMFTFESYRAWKSSLSLTDQDQNYILQHLLKEADRDMSSGRKEEALGKFLRVRDLAKAGLIYLSASENAAHLLAEKGEIQEAHDVLLSMGKKISPDGTRLLHQLAYRKGDWKETVELGKSVYQHHPDYHIAVINAISHSRLGEVRPAVGWLHCAIKEGIPNLKEVMALKEFDPIRNDSLFRALDTNH